MTNTTKTTATENFVILVGRNYTLKAVKTSATKPTFIIVKTSDGEYLPELSIIEKLDGSDKAYVEASTAGVAHLNLESLEAFAKGAKKGLRFAKKAEKAIIEILAKPEKLEEYKVVEKPKAEAKKAPKAPKAEAKPAEAKAKATIKAEATTTAKKPVAKKAPAKKATPAKNTVEAKKPATTKKAPAKKVEDKVEVVMVDAKAISGGKK